MYVDVTYMMNYKGEVARVTPPCCIPGSDCKLIDITGRAILCANEVEALYPQFTRTDDSAGVQVGHINEVADGHSRKSKWRDP